MRYRRSRTARASTVHQRRQCVFSRVERLVQCRHQHVVGVKLTFTLIRSVIKRCVLLSTSLSSYPPWSPEESHEIACLHHFIVVRRGALLIVTKTKAFWFLTAISSWRHRCESVRSSLFSDFSILLLLRSAFVLLSWIVIQYGFSGVGNEDDGFGCWRLKDESGIRERGSEIWEIFENVSGVRCLVGWRRAYYGCVSVEAWGSCRFRRNCRAMVV